MIIACAACGQNNRVPVTRLPETGTCGKCKQALPAIASPIDADQALFDEVLQGSRLPVLVDFWASWCGPCRMAAPEVAQVAKDLAGKALVLKVNSDQEPALSQRYRVSGIPHFLVLRGGKVVFERSGVARAAEIKTWL